MEDTVFARSATRKFNSWFGGMIKTLGREFGEVMEDDFVALVLGGSYGAGEGAVVPGEGGEKPAHDVDLYPVVNRDDPGRYKRFRMIAKKYESKIGARLDVKTPLVERRIHRLKNELSNWDFCHRYIVVAGDETVIERNLPKWFHQQPPEQEGARLLLRHGANLLEALRVTKGLMPESDPDFLRRSYWKCAYALGDALLISAGRYASEFDVKLENLREVTEASEQLRSADLAGLYERAADFRSRPHVQAKKKTEGKDLEELAWKWGSVFLAVERNRLKGEWNNLDEYCAYAGRRESNLDGYPGLVRNFLFGLHNGRVSFAHPRETSYTRIPTLLGLTTSGYGEVDWAGLTERLLAHMARWR